MNKIAYITILFFAVFITSCDEYLDAPTQSTMDESLIFSNVELAQGAIDGIKEPMGQTNSYRGRFLTHYGSNTDIEWNNSTSVNGRGDLSRYINSPTNSDMNRDNVYWAMLYRGIERANICIRGLRTYGNPEPGTEMGQLLGEAITLRSIYYADLLKSHGDIVARFEPISSETIYLPKSNRDEIFKHVIADLEEAATLVAWPGETEATATTEQVNKAFVKGLRARLIMAATGYAQRGGSISRSSDPELSVSTLYPIALQECKDIIASGTASLESSFESVWRKNCEEVITAGGESLWEVPFAEGRGRHLFTYAVRHQLADQYTGQPRGGTFGPLPNVFYDFDAKDTRRDVTCVPYSWSQNNPSHQELMGIDTWYFGKWRYEWMTRYVTSTNDDGVNKIYMRYAEVLLMAAEIENELNGPSAAAPYLKMIRQRAFDEADWSEKVDAYVNALNSKEAMFNAIVDEHGFELCGEMERKQALIRWNLLKSKMDEAKQKMDDLRNRTGEYADVPSVIYYNYLSDGETLDFYGLERGETDDMLTEYDYAENWATPGRLEDDKINSLYTNDPDQNQYWPIWQVFIDASNGMLNNDPVN
ncbi:RagB/SusD family nutrient uptake outer membrane protein [Draconibacterium sp. IB214405]|uniref:RagB/SusD family nutrient uptake outer membrane protein n=1 Tax=Draconibacterium sp. IB214405 TaxID=3097352 RepID=UPI002A1398EF|nr:RagB/SusD family nutrient uptake outer membrane protein [Draconibacterium sp. IB214405]MDX8338930.1 RagB/SusD family nutrient uptake outer membrane protein [Draconibacterium sp. IB214405]